MKKYFQGKLKYLTLFFAGGLGDLALAPFEFFPVLFLSFPVFFKILDAAETRKQAFKIGWMFGFGYFVFGLYWIANSLLVDAEKFAWLIPFAVCGIPFGLAIYTGLIGLIYHIICHPRRRAGIRVNDKTRIPAKDWNLGGDDKWWRIILLATLWVIFELVRGWFLTGFPWNLIGYSALFSIKFAQTAAIGGVYLLSYIVVIIALLPVYYKNRRMLGAVLLIVAGCIIYGHYHVKNASSGNKTAKIIIFQPNIEQSLKWEPLAAKKQFIENIDYVKTLDYKDADIVLWPETGTPYFLDSHPSITELLAQTAPDNGVMITGGLRSEGESKEAYRIWNTLYAIDKKGIYQSYDKIHLVPFGEFVPLRKYLPLDKITPGSMDFSSGDARNIIRYKDGPGFLSLICYEVIFPEFAHSGDKPDLLINITNDGWFGNSTGPYQHLAMSRMRSIEQGLPLLRAANSGVSAVIDSNGKVLDSLGLNRRGQISMDLELKKSITIYSIYSDVIIFGFIIINIAFLLINRKRQ